MSFVLQRVTTTGLVLSQIDAEALRIGRGTNADLRSENQVVSLEHAVIESDADGYLITDKGSITGTYVNRRPVESVRLHKGDVIEIGELRIEVQLADRGRPLFLRVESMASRKPVPVGAEIEDEGGAEAAPQAPRGGAMRAPQIDYAKAYKLDRPYLTRLSMIAVVGIVALLVTGEIIKPEKQTLFMPGTVSSAHARAQDPRAKGIAKNCSACHDPWKGVSNARCTECHGRVAHAESEAAAPACMDCHAEHRDQAKLTALPVGKCINCHADLPRHVKPGVTLASDRAAIDGFGDRHPEFSYLPDVNTLRFNHALHLEPRGILNASGKREKLECRGCHTLVEKDGKADPKPVTFAADCQRCHKLTFARDFPTAEVPHGGDPALARAFVIQTLSGNRDIATLSPAEARRRLAAGGLNIRTDERIVAAAEHVLKIKCIVCHDLARGVTKPVMLSKWLDGSRFSHTSHRNLECENCHATARRSTTTKEVLLPARDKCTSCHGAKETGSHSSCMSCHDYHGRSRDLLTKKAAAFTRSSALPPVTGGGRFGMLEVVLIAAIVILLLVVLVPFGAAMYQRLRASDEERITERQQPVRRQSVRVPPLVVPQAPAAPPPAAAPAPPPATTPAAKPSAKRDDDTAPPSPQATELVQWYGMLLCTAGALEGKRFMVEEEGFYIGRDATLSQVVIPDGRVSKRHVRIVPRDGRAHAIDQDSTNGTFIGSTANPRITDVQLKRGDVLILGDNVATFLYQV